MPEIPIKIYRKHNSFIEFATQNTSPDIALARIATLKGKSAPDCELSFTHHQILQRALIDLFGAHNFNLPKFSLSPSVLDELSQIDDGEIARYLVHRYRYEVFPESRELDNFPPYLQIEPTSVCNYRCVFCYQTDNSFNRKSKGFMGHMSIETFKGVIDRAEGNIEFVSLASRGEPLLCPDINEMLSYTRNKFLNLKMNTNASLLDEQKCHSILQSGIRTLVFSADAAEEPLYSQLRVRGNLDRVIKNIEQFQKIKSEQYSDSNMITRVSGVKVDSRQDIGSMKNIWGQLVDQVTFVDYVPWENVYDSELTDVSEPCSDLWRRMFVWWDGKVNPCDVDYKSTLTVGDMGSRGLSDLWRSRSYEELRSRHVDNERNQVSPCNRCTVV